MWTRELLKENGKIAFKRNYWTCVLVAFILGILAGGETGGFKFNFDIDSDTNYYFGINRNYYSGLSGSVRYFFLFLPIMLFICLLVIAIVFVVMAFVTNIIEIGGKRYFMENREHKTNAAQVLYGFSNGYYMNCVNIMFRRNLYILGWSLLFIIPGIIKGYSYRMIPYILAENPQISKERAFDISMQMMEGHKLEAFVLELSFIGWDLLNACTLGILGIFYVNPYKHATFAEFYTAVKAEAFAKGITNAAELPGVSYPEFTEQF